MRTIVPAFSLIFALAAAASLSAQGLGPVKDPAALITGTQIYRCGTPAQGGFGSPADHPDCDTNQTNPLAIYAPTSVLRIPVVVHVITSTGGSGNLSDTIVQSQITVLNEDFRALAGTAGAGGVDTKIEFFLATTDPSGNPTNGITRHANTTWFNDGGSYWNTIAWDPTRYLNIYTNSAGGGTTLGYVPDLPAGGGVLNTLADRVVILHSAFGRPATGGAPYNLGRTCTHEVGHYLGLFHTFQGGCGTASCYTTGDRICDTNAEQTARFGCPTTATSCGSPDPIRNYLDYTDDSCMTGYTQEQARRMRCTLQHYRPALAQPAGPIASAVTRDGAGNLNGRYSSTAPRLGQTMTSQVVMFGLPYTLGTVYAYTGQASAPFTPWTILVDLNSTPLYQLPFVASTGLFLGWTLPVPSDNALSGLQFSSQALLLDATTFALTNAVDMVVGS